MWNLKRTARPILSEQWLPIQRKRLVRVYNVIIFTILNDLLIDACLWFCRDPHKFHDHGIFGHISFYCYYFTINKVICKSFPTNLPECNISEQVLWKSEKCPEFGPMNIDWSAVKLKSAPIPDTLYMTCCRWFANHPCRWNRSLHKVPLHIQEDVSSLFAYCLSCNKNHRGMIIARTISSIPLEYSSGPKLFRLCNTRLFGTYVRKAIVMKLVSSDQDYASSPLRNVMISSLEDLL